MCIAGSPSSASCLRAPRPLRDCRVSIAAAISTRISSARPSEHFAAYLSVVSRAFYAASPLCVRSVNDPFLDLAYAKYQLAYDSVHGRFPGTIEAHDGKLVINGKEIQCFTEKDPANIPWGRVGAEYVCESTGVFVDKEKASLHIKGGAKRVVISAVRLVALVIAACQACRCWCHTRTQSLMMHVLCTSACRWSASHCPAATHQTIFHRTQP